MGHTPGVRAIRLEDKGVIEMTSRSGYLVVALVVLAAMLTMTSVAFAVLDEFGGGSFRAAYAPYTAGPVVTEEEAYAPYTAGPVVRRSLPVQFRTRPTPLALWSVKSSRMRRTPRARS